MPTDAFGTDLFNGSDLEGAEPSSLVDVAHSLHQRTDNDLSVVLKEVDL